MVDRARHVSRLVRPKEKIHINTLVARNTWIRSYIPCREKKRSELTLLVGKTHLARIAVYEAQKVGHSLFAFLSYTISSSISALSILHSLIFQLTTDNVDLQSIVAHSIGEDLRRDLDVAQGVFKTLLCSAGPVYISIDGLDEIAVVTRCRILGILLQFATEIDTLRVMISCRPEADLTSLLSEKCSTVRVNEQNGGGVQSYISQRTSSWYEERAFYPEARKEMKALLAPLAEKSKGKYGYQIANRELTFN